jgi:hypothetical protein
MSKFRDAREFASSQLPRDPETGELYPYISTSLKDFGKIGGPGVSLYFDFLKQASLVMVSCFVFSLVFFLRNYEITSGTSGVPAILRGSAVFPNGTDPGFGDFGSRWDANVMELGVFVSFVFFAVSIGRHQRLLADEIDDIYSTAQDYTICVRRPPSSCFPGGAQDVRDYFERSVRCKVVAVTLERDNSVLGRAQEDFSIHLIKARRILREGNKAKAGAEVDSSSIGSGSGEADDEARIRAMLAAEETGGRRPGVCRRFLWSLSLCRDIRYHIWMMCEARKVASRELRAMRSSSGEGEWKSFALGRISPIRGGDEADEKPGAAAAASTPVQEEELKAPTTGVGSLILTRRQSSSFSDVPPRRSGGSVLFKNLTTTTTTAASGSTIGMKTGLDRSFDVTARGGSTVVVAAAARPSSSSSSFRSEQFVRAFVTFQTEQQQRRALRYLRRGWCERMVAVDPVARCDTTEAPEPSDVLWDVGIRSWLSVKVRSLGSWLATATTIAACFYVTSLLQALRVQKDRELASNPTSSSATAPTIDALTTLLPGVAIALINWMLPVVIMAFTSRLESHESYSSRERSASVKLVIGRVANTALVPFLATPAPTLVDPSFLQKILFLQISNFVVSNLLRFLDPGTMWVRYVHGLFARTRGDLEDLWVGGEWFVSERYSDVISIISIAAFFGPLVPISYAVAAATLCAAYWNDKYLLLRYWRRPPELDTSAASYASRFFVTTLVVHLLVASWIAANWPLTSISAATLRWEVGVPEVDFSDKTYWRRGMGVLAVGLVVSACVTFAISLFVGAERCCSKGAVEVFRGSSGASGKVGSRPFTKLRPRPHLYAPHFRVPGSDYARPTESTDDREIPPPPPAWAGMETPAPSRTEVSFFKPQRSLRSRGRSRKIGTHLF